MAAFAKLGFEYKKTAPKEKRNPDWITWKQEKYIKGLWQLVGRDKREAALNSFIERITGIAYIDWLMKPQAADVIVALRKMACEQGINPDRKD